jgi:hypothetical protein
VQIIWDEAKKKWVNKDGEEEGDADFKPPPKMGDMMGNHAPPQMPQAMPQLPQMTQMPQTQPSMPQQQAQSPAPIASYQQPMQQSPNPAASDAMPMQPAAPNMFKMQKGRSELEI